MADPDVVVTCPRCGYPYPMTSIQREVYRGRNMGCMNCGRPFAVDLAQTTAVTLPDPASDIPPLDKATPENKTAALALMTNELIPATNASPALFGDPMDVSAEHGKPSPKSGLRVLPQVRASTSAIVGLVSGIVGIVLAILTLATASIVRNGAPTHQSDIAVKVTLSVLLSLTILATFLALTGGVLGLRSTRRPPWAERFTAHTTYNAGRAVAATAVALGAAGFLVGVYLFALLLPIFRGGA